MFFNLITKIADKDYFTFAECFFDFTHGGERSCEIRVVNYDKNGKFLKEENLSKIESDIQFLYYAQFIIVWYAQMVDRIIQSRDHTALKNIYFGGNGTLFDALFGQENQFNLPDVLALFDQKIKNAVIDEHATVQFKIHKTTKQTLVRVTNLPTSLDKEGQLYLFVILIDYFCKNYANAYNLIRYGCMMLRSKDNELSDSNPFQAIAYEVTNMMAKEQMNKLIQQAAVQGLIEKAIKNSDKNV